MKIRHIIIRGVPIDVNVLVIDVFAEFLAAITPLHSEGPVSISLMSLRVCCV